MHTPHKCMFLVVRILFYVKGRAVGLLHRRKTFKFFCEKKLTTMLRLVSFFPPFSYGKIILIFYLYVTAIGQCNKSQRELWKWGGLWLSSVVISRIWMLMLISTRRETGVVWNVFVSGLVIGIWLIRGRLATLDHSKEPDPNTVIKWIAGCDLWQSCSVCHALLSLALCTNRST